jgi:23S rRNA maturation-related 3'-5' exoribonuclease YhaM
MKSTGDKSKNRQMKHHLIKCFDTVKETINTVTTTHIEWEKMFASNEGLIYEICKELILNIIRQIIPLTY